MTCAPSANPFAFAMEFQQNFMKSCLDAQAQWMNAATQSVTMGAAKAQPATNGFAAPKPARSWYRAPAPTWAEVAQSYGWPMPFANMMSQFMQAGPTVPFGQSSNAAMLSPFMSLLQLQAQWLQAAMAPLQAMSSNLSTGTSASMSPRQNGAQPNGSILPVISGEIVKSEDSRNGAPKSDVAVASITLPDNTTFRITVPMTPPAAAFWPWASAFGASSYATPPAESAKVEADASAAEKALSETLRRSYLKSRM